MSACTAKNIPREYCTMVTHTVREYEDTLETKEDSQDLTKNVDKEQNTNKDLNQDNIIGDLLDIFPNLKEEDIQTIIDNPNIFIVILHENDGPTSDGKPHIIIVEVEEGQTIDDNPNVTILEDNDDAFIDPAQDILEAAMEDMLDAGQRLLLHQIQPFQDILQNFFPLSKSHSIKLYCSFFLLKAFRVDIVMFDYIILSNFRNFVFNF